MKLVRLIQMCLNETYSKVRIGKHLSDSFPIQNGLKQGDSLFKLHSLSPHNLFKLHGLSPRANYTDRATGDSLWTLFFNKKIMWD
jgi:hypothetical protein